MYIILHKGRPLDNTVFHSYDKAILHLKFKNTKRKFKINNNVFTCCLNGAKFEIINLVLL